MPQGAPGINAQRLRTTLKMAISKLKFLQEKKTALTKQQRRQLADLLGAGKEISAKIRVENIIRDDIYVELLEYCELYCELLLARSSIILDMSRTEVDGGLQDAVSSIIYCCGHTEVKELISLGDMLRMRYGAEFTKRVLENEDGALVPKKIVSRCDIEPPSESLVDLYLTEIARTYEVPYSAAVEMCSEVDGSGDDSGDGNDGSGLKELAEELLISSEGESNDAEKQKIADVVAEAVASKPSMPKKPISKAKAEQNEFDQLKERFAALKRT